MKNVKRITSILIFTSMTIVIFAGCSSTKAADTANTNNTNSQSRKFDPAAMKTLYSDTLKTLVTAGTITQAQSDKVLEAETKNIPRGAGTSKPAGTTNQSSATKPTGTNPRNNKLSALVTNVVITQAQANTINQSIQDVMKNNKSKAKVA